MASKSITFLDLPPELIHSILVHAVLLRGLKRALRLRLVNSVYAQFIVHIMETNPGLLEFFSKEVVQALYTSEILEDLCRLPHRYPRLNLEYLQFRTLGQRGYVTPPRKVIRQIADLLCVENDVPVSSAHKTREAYIKQLCSLAFRRNNCLSSFFQESRKIDDDEQALRGHLFVAAVHTNSLSLVKRLIDQQCNPWAVSSLFGLSLTAAAIQGHDEILEVLLSTCSPLSIRRYMALICSSEEGHMNTVELVLQPRWGPWDLGNENSRDRAALNKALNTPNPQIFRRILAARENTPLQGSLSKALMGDLINTCASNGWLDTTRCLLEMGAPADGFRISPTNRPIMEACRRGFTKTVQILLEHGADTRGALTRASRSGFLEIVRVLLDHGCDVNEGSPPPIVAAVELEHKRIFQLLREKGADLDGPGTGDEAAARAKAAGLQSMLDLLSREGVNVENVPACRLPPTSRCFCPESHWP